MTKKTKNFIFIMVGLIIIFVVWSLMNSERAVSPDITIRGIQTATAAQEDYILVKAKEKYYEVYSSSDFSQLFSFENWKIIKEINKEEDVIISLRFAELFVIDVYKNGMVAAYDGYAAREYSSSAYYKMPITAIEKIINFLEENAILHKFGDGTISNSTFIHD